MIIIKTTDVQSEIKIPTIYSKSVDSGLYTIRLENTSTHFDVSFSNVTDYSNSPLYYSFFINTSGIEKGEYEYEVLEQSLLDDEQYSVAIGLLRIERERNASHSFSPSKDTRTYKSGKNAYKTLSRVREYLYKVTYDTLDYDAAEAYLEETYSNFSLGQCTSIVLDGKLGRNLDWYYSNLPEFVVKTKAHSGRHATLCVGGNIPGLTSEVVESRVYRERFTYLPFTVVDGINDAGLMCSVNVVASTGVTPTTGTHPGYHRLNGMMIPRFILDNFDNAHDAVYEVATNRDVYMPHNERLSEEFHYIVSDANETYILEFVNNQAVILECPENNAYITNFRVKDIEFDASGYVIPQSVEQYGMGIERYDSITAQIRDAEDLPDILHSLYYSGAYTKLVDNDLPDWKTEFTGQYGQENLTVTSPREDFRRVFSIARHNFETRDRNNPVTWFTQHTSVYDPSDLSLTISVQEDWDKSFTFKI